MSPALGQAVLELVTDHKKLVAGLQTAGTAARAWGGKMISAGGDIANGLRPLTSIIQNVISSSADMASSTEESLNKVRVVFKESAADVEAWAATSAKSLGISRQRALEAAGTFGNLFTAMGLGRPAAAGLSMDVVKLAADLASFNNIKPEEALEKLRAGLVGEAEPLRTLGVNLSAAAMEAYALKNGIGEAGRELTDAEKITARYGLIVEQTKNAQGDFANTSDGLANSLRIQKAEQENVQAQLGVALIPVMKTATQAITGIMTAFSGLSSEWQTGIMIVGGLLVVLGPLLTVIGVLTGAVGLLIGIMIPAQGSILATTIAIGGMNIALGPLILIIGAVALAVGLLYLAWTNNWGGIQDKAAAVIGFLTSTFETFRDFFVGLWNGLPGPVRDAIAMITAPISGLIGMVQTAIGWLSQLGGARASAGNHAATGNWNGGMSVGAYASGTNHVTRGPELFLAGERGPERVQVTPLASAAGSGGLGGGGHGHDILMDGRVVASAVGRRTVRGAAFAGGPIG